jgi:MFS family permease
MKRKTDIRFFYSENAIILYLVVAKILFHLFHPEYGYFRDEFYYIAIGDSFSFENLDMMPLTPLYLKLITTIFGYSIKSIHLASSICGALSLVLTCLITRRLGGREFAILLTGLLVMFSGFMIFGALFTYDSIDFLIQTFALYLLVRIIKENNPKLWILFGLMMGLGILNKLSILIFGLAVFISLWLLPQRKYFKGKWIWLGGLIALVFSIPFVLWQSMHGWYYLDFVTSYSGGTAYVTSFPEFLWSQILPNNVFGLPFWLTGLGLLLFSSRWKKYRLFGLMYVIVFFMAYFLGVKFYFTIPMYVVLFAAGSVKLEEFFSRRGIHRTRIRFARVAVLFGYVVLSLPLLPMIVPLLPVESFVKYVAVLGVHAGVRHENTELTNLPQHVADRFGWEEMVDQVAAVYDSVTSGTGDEVGIITGNYGQAGAIHLLGKKYNLPEPISHHGWFYFEALRSHEFRDSYISIGLPRGMLNNIFAEVIQQGIYTHPYCMPYENNNPMYLCRQPRFDLRTYWLVAKNMDSRFVDILRNRGVEAAIAYYHESRNNNPSVILFTEGQMNALGYEYLYSGKTEEAIALFKLNVEAYPEAYNVYDSLGEGYMENGQYELSIINYKKSLELNAGNSNAREKLEELENLINNDGLK